MGNTSWFELGQEVGLEVVSEDEVADEEAIRQTEEDKEVEVILKTNWEKHDKFKRGKIKYMS